MFFIIIIALTGCEGDKDISKQKDRDVWKLVEVRNSLIAQGAEVASELPFNEDYKFYTDSTFKKTRIEDTRTLTGNGTYTTQVLPGEGTYYQLNYHTAHSIVGSCTGRDTETLLLRPDGKIQNSWMMCDGPFMMYEKN